MPRALPLLSLLLALSLMLAGCGEATHDCALVKVAQLKLQMEHGLPLVPIAINGKPVWMVADSGAERSLLTEAAVARLELPHDIGHVSHTMGVGGPSTSWDVALGSLVMGGVRFPVERFAVGRFTIGSDREGAPAGLLGADILLAFDLDFDVPHGVLTLYRARRCPDARPPWEATAVPLLGIATRKDRLLVPISLDGAQAMAVLDTGAQHTTVGSELAARVGVTEVSMAPDPVILQHGAGPEAVPSHLHRFASLVIGPATISGPQLTVVSSRFGVGDAIVGQDFLQGRRVWMSFATQQVFVTPLAGDTPITAAP